MGISALLVDLGGVLFVPDTAWVRGELERVGLSVSEGAVRRAHHVAVRAFDEAAIGDNRLAYTQIYPTAFLSSLGLPPPAHGRARKVLFEGADIPRVEPLRESVSALRALVERRFPVAVVANTFSGHAAARLESLGFVTGGENAVLTVIDSARAGVAKLHRRIFAMALRELGVSAREAVHVGDSVRLDGNGARAAGIAFYHFDPHDVCDQRHEHVANLHALAVGATHS